MKKNLAIILAGGTGNRIRSELPKQFFLLEGKTILQHTLEKFELHPEIHEIFLVCHPDFLERAIAIVQTSDYRKVSQFLAGGKTRQDSSRIGVTAADPGDFENVLIHDAARPFISHDIIDQLLEKLGTYSAVNVAIPSADTIIEINASNHIKAVPDRQFLRRVQTPQAFKLQLIRRAHDLALQKNIIDATDDCSLVFKLQLADILVVPGSETNIKITYPDDLDMAAKILEKSRENKNKKNS